MPGSPKSTPTRVRVILNQGYIDLSKSKVNAEDENIGKEKFANSKALHSIIINISK